MEDTSNDAAIAMLLEESLEEQIIALHNFEAKRNADQIEILGERKATEHFPQDDTSNDEIIAIVLAQEDGEHLPVHSIANARNSENYENYEHNFGESIVLCKKNKETESEIEFVSYSLFLSNVIEESLDIIALLSEETANHRTGDTMTNLPTPTMDANKLMRLPDDKKNCVICLCDIEVTEAKHLPCLHIFHSACIDEWLKNSMNCPLCKHSVNEYGYS